MNQRWVAASILVLVFAFTITHCDVTPVNQCPGQSTEGLRERIDVIPCGKKKCKLHRRTNITVNFRFKTQYEVTQLKNDVFAEVGGIPLPFLGVTGASVCKRVTRADTGEPSPCPLAANTEYKVSDVFPVEDFYPLLNLKVHWSLKSQKDDDVICFEVPAIILPAKTSAT